MKVVNVRNEQSTHYIGRGTSRKAHYGIDANLGNPFWMLDESKRDYICDQFECMARDNPAILDRIKALPEDAVLGCFCAPKHCHGDIIVKLWKEMNREQEEELQKSAIYRANLEAQG